MRHLIAVAIYDGLRALEYSIIKEVLAAPPQQLRWEAQEMLEGPRKKDPLVMQAKLHSVEEQTRLLTPEAHADTEPLQKVGEKERMAPDWYRFLPCRVESGRLSSHHGLEIDPSGNLEDLAAANTVIVGGWRNIHERPPELFLAALRTAHARGARLVAIGCGVFPLAHAGLLDNRRVTTHWLHADSLRKAFQEINVQEDSLYIHDRSSGGQISTCAGNAASLDLCLSLIREDFGQTISNEVAKRMVAPVHRSGSQSQFIETPTGIAETEPFGPVLDWMINHLDEELTIQVIAKRFGFSIRTFQRRFKELTSMSPHQWLVLQRVARACELLESSGKSVEHVANLSGLGSAANLRKHFAQHVATTPRAYRSAYRGAPRERLLCLRESSVN